VPLVQAVVFEPSAHHVKEEQIMLHSRVGLSINVSSTGLCLLVDQCPAPGEVWRVRIPSATQGVQTPTLADVRWVRPLPFVGSGLVIVGLKFIL
jgi:hypothetical protein